MKKYKKKMLSILAVVTLAIGVPVIVTSCAPTISINNQGKPEFGEFIEWASTLTRWNVRTWNYNYRNTPTQIKNNIALQNALLRSCVENLLTNASLLNKYNIKASVVEITEINDKQGYLTITISLDGWVSQGQRINQISEQVFHLLGFNTI